MKVSKKVVLDLFKGIIGGIFIAVGSLSAIGFTENAVNCVPAIVLLIIGAFAGILLDTLKVNKIIVCIISVSAFCLVFFPGLEYVKYASAGIVMYIGCALALPEKDILTNAVTGASAAAGFITAVLAIL